MAHSVYCQLIIKVKRLKPSIALNGASLAIWDHTVLPST